MKIVQFGKIQYDLHDEEKQLRAHIFTIILLTMLAAAVMTIIITWLFQPTKIIPILAVAAVATFVSLLANKVGHTQIAGLILLLSIILSLFALQYVGQGAHDISISVYPILIIVASILQRRLTLIVVTAVAITAYGLIVYLEIMGHLTTNYDHVTGLSDWLSMVVVLVVTAVAMRLLTNQLWDYLEHTHAQKEALLTTNFHLVTQRNALQASEEEARHFQAKLHTLHEVNIELAYTATLEELYKQAIIYGRERLGFDRLGLLLYDEETQTMIGTFGTDEQGNLRDERTFSMKLNKPEILQILINKEQTGFWEMIDLLDEGRVVGRGWNALSVMWNGKKGIGWLAADNLLKQEPASPMMLEILTLYGAMLGHLVTGKQSEIALRQYAIDLERSNRELQEFAYIASHDLQEPLRKIQTFGDRLTVKYDSVLDERGLLYLDRMQDAAARMQILIRDLLIFSRVQSRGESFAPVNLTELLNEVLSDLEAHSMDVSATFRLHELPIVYADNTQMRQLFQNLISNALKFHHPDVPPLIIIMAEQMVDDKSNRPMCRITVADNGIGFEQQYAERIFGMFQRLHGRSSYEGSGIGLAICKRIVERHHGRITAEGTLNKGATFTIVLPLGQE